MEPVTLTAVATANATIVLTKALEKTGEKLGETALNSNFSTNYYREITKLRSRIIFKVNIQTQIMLNRN